MKKKLLIGILTISIVLNFFLLGKWYFFERGYEETEKEYKILGEMVVKTIESDDYQKIAQKEQILSINYGVDRYKGGVFPYYMSVFVKTKDNNYMFDCADKTCEKVEISGESYSIYQDEPLALPLKK